MGVIEDLAAKVDGLKCELDLMRDEMNQRVDQLRGEVCQRLNDLFLRIADTTKRVNGLDAAALSALSEDIIETDKDVGATNDRINRLNEKVCDMRHVLDRIERMLPLPCAKATVTDSEKTQSSTVPGTWAWACEQMLAGKTVRRPGVMRHANRYGTIQFNRNGEWEDAHLIRTDLTATDWQVVE